MERTSVVRRSVTVRPVVDARLRDFLAACMRYGIDIDYTKALNLFAELGIRWLDSSNRQERKEFSDVWKSYLDYEAIESSEAFEDWVEYEEFRRWKATPKKNSAR